jgi:excisionase family DNA binding protein
LCVEFALSGRTVRDEAEVATKTEEQRLLRVREVADVMRVSSMTVYRLIRTGELAAVRVGRSYRIWESDVITYLQRGAA